VNLVADTTAFARGLRRAREALARAEMKPPLKTIYDPPPPRDKPKPKPRKRAASRTPDSAPRT
jgi:hypothetical protein